MLGHPVGDWLAGVLVQLCLIVAGGSIYGNVLRHMTHDDRVGLYQTLAGITGGLLGFYIATVSILLGLMNSESPRMATVLSGENRRKIQSYFFTGVTTAAVALVLELMLIFVERGTAPLFAEWAVVVPAVAMGVATARIIWLLKTLLEIASLGLPEGNSS